MINRENWIDTKKFIAYLAKIGRDEETIKRVRGILWHLLEWADETPFPKGREIDLAFPAYLLGARSDGSDKPLGAASMKKICEYSRMFFEWIRWESPARYKSISKSWVETIRPSVARGLHSEFHEHQFWTVEAIKKIAALQPKNITWERDIAAVCFMFLSAMRVQAFVSLPVEAVHLDRRVVRQFPELGVRTKNRKAGKTQMLKIPELLEVVLAWDEKVRAAGARLWYPRIDRWHRFMTSDAEPNWLSMTKILNAGLRELCQAAGVPYLSSHKLRHGHIVYAIRQVKDMKGLKAVSQNAMHSSVAITDGIYGRLVSDDIAEVYDGLGE